MTSNELLVAERGCVYEKLLAYTKNKDVAARIMDCLDLIRVKGSDYTRGQHNIRPTAFFEDIGKFIDIDPAKVWAVLANKHWSAIMRYVKDGYVESEDISGRINDMINYLLLFGLLLTDKREI